MAESWSKLRLMFGLDEEQPGMKRNPKRADLKEYFEELRPDVVHGSLFV